jgi:hypothetical protein
MRVAAFNTGRTVRDAVRDPFGSSGSTRATAT